jgi:hypothetical protein
MSKPLLSKSKYLNGVQCPKLLWYQYNAKDKIPAYDARTQAIFDQGHVVGELAKQVFPEGIDVEWNLGLKEVDRQSRKLLAERKPLFEAGFMANGTYARVDVLNPVADGKWDLIEVKSGTDVKQINYADVALQKYCYEGAGVRINNCYLMHINRDYVRQGEIDPVQLFVQKDITHAVATVCGGVADRVQEMQDIIALKTCPEPGIGPHCSDPYECVLQPVCWEKALKHENNVFTLTRASGRQWRLYEQGIVRNEEIPWDFELTDKQRIMVDAEKAGEPYIVKESVRQFLSQLEYPLCYMDFETFGFGLPIPLLDHTRPYDQVPFQFSVHVVNELHQVTEHHSWLWDGNGDPRPEFMAQLKKSLGDKGSIVVYNQGFEKRVIRESAEFLEEYASWVLGINDRIVDLMTPFQQFAIYYPSQHGKYSIKKVLPALTGKSYDDMEISEGGQASNEFMRVTFGDVDEGDRQMVRQNLEAYCGLDTMGMVDIVRVLVGMIGPS